MPAYLNPQTHYGETPFIALEGIDRTGKTGIAYWLADRLALAGQEALVTWEPGATRIGSRIRDMLLHEDGEPPSAMGELLLFAADQAENVDKVIKPALKRNTAVICDRFYGSSIGYQTTVPMDQVEEVTVYSLGNPFYATHYWPHLVIYLDADPEVTLEQIPENSRDNYESKGLGYYHEVADRYRKYASIRSDWRTVRVTEGGGYRSQMDVLLEVALLVSEVYRIHLEMSESDLPRLQAARKKRLERVLYI